MGFLSSSRQFGSIWPNRIFENPLGPKIAKLTSKHSENEVRLAIFGSGLHHHEIFDFLLIGCRYGLANQESAQSNDQALRKLQIKFWWSRSHRFLQFSRKPVKCIQADTPKSKENPTPVIMSYSDPQSVDNGESYSNLKILDQMYLRYSNQSGKCFLEISQVLLIVRRPHTPH